MESKSVLVEERSYSKADLVKAKKLVREAEKNMKNPVYREAAKEFYKYHTGKTLKI